MVSGALGLAMRHHRHISEGTVNTVWISIITMPMVRIRPNSESALNLAVASAAVAVAAVRMHRKMLKPVVSKVR